MQVSVCPWAPPFPGGGSPGAEIDNMVFWLCVLCLGCLDQPELIQNLERGAPGSKWSLYTVVDPSLYPPYKFEGPDPRDPFVIAKSAVEVHGLHTIRYKLHFVGDFAFFPQNRDFARARWSCALSCVVWGTLPCIPPINLKALTPLTRLLWLNVQLRFMGYTRYNTSCICSRMVSIAATFRDIRIKLFSRQTLAGI